MRKRYKSIFCCLLGLTFVIYVTWRGLLMELMAVFSSNQLYCYWSRSNGIIELGQGDWDEAMLIPSRCIFFHETTCSKPRLTPRQACAIESAARNNHNLNTFVLFLANGQFAENSRKLINILESYDNVYIRRIRLSTYIANTPIENWFLEVITKFSENRIWLRKDFHDYIRMLTLWKYGGVALNLDSVVHARLDKLTTFAGVQDDRDMSVGVFGVDRSTDFGRKFINTCIKIIKNTNLYNYSRYNITRIITEAVQKLCYQENVFNKECRQFTIYSPKKFYPISVSSWRDYFDESKAEQTMEIIKNAITIHLWNNYSKDTKANNTAAYIMIAKKDCPKIYKYSKDKF